MSFIHRTLVGHFNPLAVHRDLSVCRPVDGARVARLLAEEKGRPASVGEVVAVADFKKKAEDGGEGKNPMVKLILEAAGEGGFLVSLVDEKKEQAGGLVVRVKGESAKVVGLVPGAAAGTKE